MERKRRFPMNLYNKLEERLKTKSEENDTQAPAIEVPAIEEKRIKCPKCGKMVERERVVKHKRSEERRVGKECRL